MIKRMFWGYLHSNGSVQVKPWFGDHEDYTGDCQNNPFVVKVVKPFNADNYEQARAYVCVELSKPEQL